MNTADIIIGLHLIAFLLWAWDVVAITRQP
jgi:hypothetical protein